MSESSFLLLLSILYQELIVKIKDGIYYFAHPLTNGDSEPESSSIRYNYELCVLRTARLMQAGYLVYSPIVHSYRPHEYLNWTWRKWLEYDSHMIKAFDFTGIIFAPKWHLSKGCRREKELFDNLNKKILHYRDLCPLPST